jgi:hypothetical protein
MYVSVFVKLVKDAHDKKFNDESMFSLLGAFKGVAAVGHILLKDALANVNYVGHSSSSYNLVQEADDTWREFEQEMDILEEKFRAVSKSTKAYQVGFPFISSHTVCPLPQLFCEIPGCDSVVWVLQILRPTMTHAMKHTIFFISAMVASHERVLGYVPGADSSSTMVAIWQNTVWFHLCLEFLFFGPITSANLAWRGFLQVPRGVEKSGLRMMGNPTLQGQVPVSCDWFKTDFLEKGLQIGLLCPRTYTTIIIMFG